RDDLVTGVQTCALPIFSISAGLAASTVTPGSTAPDVSLTTPAMLPLVADCAHSVAGSTRGDTTVSIRAIRRSFMVFLPLQRSTQIGRASCREKWRSRVG